MATTGVKLGPTFVDTNVLILAAITGAPRHARAVGRLVALAGAGSELWVSRQVLREYIAALSRPQAHASPLPAATLVADVLRLQTLFRVADDNAAVTANLLSLLATVPTGGKQVHDANIVATMQAFGVARLLTHNTADFARFGTLIQIDPL